MDEIADWVSQELAPWEGVRIAKDDLHRSQREACGASTTMRILRIRDGRVEIEPHHDDRSSTPVSTINVARAQLYRSTIERLVREYSLVGSCEMLVQIGDGSMDYRHMPSFAFQKVRGAATILIPDVDLLSMNLDDPSLQDGLRFEEKAKHAIFVGSTTGRNIDAEVVLSGKHERLRAAVSFRDAPGVTFELPSVAQCDSPETEQLIANLGITGRRRSWQEQFGSRYLISMDGNGATCSRVAIALRSQSVLVKYNSAHMLYYFHGLRPWVHYIPMRLDTQLIELVENADATFDRDENIATQGRDFAERYLSRAAIDRYFADVLRRYIAIFGL
jgi:hypothetical protein